MSEFPLIDLGEVPLDDIQPNDYNPNHMTESEFLGLCESIKLYGFRGNITLRPNPEPGPKWRIVDGEQRYRACREVGRETIPAEAQELPEAHAKLSTLNMNNLKGSHNPLQEARLLVQISQEIDPVTVMKLNGMRPIEFQEALALLEQPEEQPLVAKGEEDPPVNVTLTLFPADHLSYAAALERAVDVMPEEDTVVLVRENVGAYDAAMQRAQRLLKVQKRGDAMARICQFFLHATDEEIQAVFPDLVPAKSKKKKKQSP